MPIFNSTLMTRASGLQWAASVPTTLLGDTMPTEESDNADQHAESASYDSHKHRRRNFVRRRRLVTPTSGAHLILSAAWCAVIASTLARAFVLPLGNNNHRGAVGGGGVRRLRGNAWRRGPPFRRRRIGGVRHEAARARRGLRLSAAAMPVAAERPRLMDMAWPILMSMDSSRKKSDAVSEASGFSAITADVASCDRGPTGGFEGPEKTLEIEFDPDVGHEDGLRAVRREQWDAILEQAQCQILHHRGNECFDSYVLSESSLFVYGHKLVLKTCGTTTLLRCLPLLTVVTKNYGLSLEWIGYSRKDFTFPTDQIYPHTSFAQEVDFLQTMFTGSAYVHGPLNSDHWYTYVADDGKRPDSAVADRTLNLMMYDLEPDIATNFYKSDEIQTAQDVSLQSGIRAVLPNATLQDHLFEPCGYSMNALEGRAYYTIHVTPESDFSYASFETNVRLPDYDRIVRGVLEVFRPRKFTMTLFAERTGMEDIKQNPFDAVKIKCASTRVTSRDASYTRTLTTTTNFAGDYLSQMGNWVRDPADAVSPIVEMV